LLGLFVADRGISIIEKRVNTVPELCTRFEASDGTRYRLRCIDAVLLDDEPHSVAFYEEVTPTRWELAIRKVGGGEEFGSF
jgi:hypothetical protein